MGYGEDGAPETEAQKHRRRRGRAGRESRLGKNMITFSAIFAYKVDCVLQCNRLTISHRFKREDKENILNLNSNRCKVIPVHWRRGIENSTVGF